MRTEMAMTDADIWREDEVPPSHDVIFWAIQMHGDLSDLSPEGVA